MLGRFLLPSQPLNVAQRSGAQPRHKLGSSPMGMDADIGLLAIAHLAGVALHPVVGELRRARL